MIAEEIVYIDVQDFGRCLSDRTIGYNSTRGKFYKAAFINGKHRQVSSDGYHGPWSINKKAV
jgi:hypothetical protein